MVSVDRMSAMGDGKHALQVPPSEEMLRCCSEQAAFISCNFLKATPDRRVLLPQSAMATRVLNAANAIVVSKADWPEVWPSCTIFSKVQASTK